MKANNSFNRRTPSQGGVTWVDIFDRTVVIK